MIDRYALTGVLGEGAMGRVYLAYDPKFNREVALKVIRDTMIDDERVRKWFHREARAIAQLQHPGIVEVHDYSGQEAKIPYLVMERLHGHTLKGVVEKRGVCSGAVLCELAIQIGQALMHAHSQGLVHRDLKPDNLFVEPQGRIVVTDFGLARAQMNVDLGASLASMGTSVVGTPLFLAPEAIHDPNQAGPRSDLYAVGVILYYCASMKMPFIADDPFQALSRILSGQHLQIHQLRKDLEKPVCDAIERTFAMDPAKRPQNGAELEALFSGVRDKIGGGDSLAALVSFLHQTDEFNTFTKATQIGAQEISISTPPGEDPNMATHPNPITVTVQTPVAVPENTVVGRKSEHTQVVTVARTQVVTAKSGGESEQAPAASRAWLIVVAAVVISLVVIGGVLIWRAQQQQKVKAPIADVVAQPPPPDPRERDLPPPPPTEKVAVPVVESPPPTQPKADKRPKIEKQDPGTLRVNTGSIWADIYVNGEKRGQTPFKASIELPPGKYKIRLMNPDFTTQEHTIVIEPGEVTPLKVALKK